MKVWSSITLNVTNEHTLGLPKDGFATEGGARVETFQICPGAFLEVPEWVQDHPVFQAATRPYKDVFGTEREADVLVLEDANEYVFPNQSTAPVPLPVSGTNVSENPQAGKPRKGVYAKNADFAAQASPAAIVDEGLTDGAK